MKHILLIVLCLFGNTKFVSTQNKKIDPNIDPRNFSETFVMLDMELRQKANDLSKYTTLDTSELSIIYQKRFIQDTTKWKARIDTIRLYLGHNYTCSFSQCLYLMDSVYTAHHCCDPYGGVGLYDGATYYRDIQNDKLIVVNRIPVLENTAIEYTQSTPQFDWLITSDSTSKIIGYDCVLAQTQYAGRKWRVWFAPYLPINGGPWKFGGLPGLILKAEDDRNEYCFEAIGLLKIQSEIRYYLWKIKKMLSAEWQKYDKKLHANPYDYLSNSGKTLFLYLNKTAPKPYLDRDIWQAPYNPIERE